MSVQLVADREKTVRASTIRIAYLPVLSSLKYNLARADIWVHTLHLKLNVITSEDVQRQILGVLLEAARADPTGWGVDRSLMQQRLKVPEKNMDANMAFLARKGLVRLVEVPNFYWLWAKLTPYGVRYAERELSQEYIVP